MSWHRRLIHRQLHRRLIRRPILPLLCAVALGGCLDERKDNDGGAAGGAGGAVTGDAAAGQGGSGGGSGGSGSGGALAPDAAGADRLPIGSSCVASAECESGLCALPCQGFGVCAPSSCESNSDCAVEGAPGTYCCANGACEAISGDSCGDHAGAQGAPCGDAGQSACAEGFECLDRCLPAAYCTAPCEDDATCAELGEDLGCFRIFTGEQRCVVDPDLSRACERSQDCGAMQACAPFSSFDGSSIIKACLPEYGSAPVGARCADNATCRSGYCLANRCTTGCVEDADCACDDVLCLGDQVCVDVWFQVSREPGVAALRLCTDKTRCESDADCGDEICAAYPEREGWSGLCEAPRPNTKDAGQACAGHGECKSGACLEDTCRALCADDAHCQEAGETCQPTDLQASVGGGQIGLCR